MSIIIESAIVILSFCFICFYGMKLQRKCSEEKYLSKESTTNLRGLLAVGIVLHHASGYYTELSFISSFRYVGYLIVALFFFLSGYGLQYGFENKKRYMRSFLRNRLCVILIPYWIATTLEFVLFCYLYLVQAFLPKIIFYLCSL